MYYVRAPSNRVIDIRSCCMLQGTRQLEACAFVTVEVEIKSFVMYAILRFNQCHNSY